MPAAGGVVLKLGLKNSPKPGLLSKHFDQPIIQPMSRGSSSSSGSGSCSKTRLKEFA